jgi:hypothetical protein
MDISTIFFGNTEIIKFTISLFVILGLFLFGIIKTKSVVIAAAAGVVGALGCYSFEMLNIITLIVLGLIFGIPLLLYIVFRRKD